MISKWPTVFDLNLVIFRVFIPNCLKLVLVEWFGVFTMCNVV